MSLPLAVCLATLQERGLYRVGYAFHHDANNSRTIHWNYEPSLDLHCRLALLQYAAKLQLIVQDPRPGIRGLHMERGIVEFDTVEMKVRVRWSSVVAGRQGGAHVVADRGGVAVFDLDENRLS